MSAPFLGEIRLVSFNYPPKGWAMCNGQLMAINQNQALFAVLGTMYGGDGVSTFALPNLQGRVPLHAGVGLVQSQSGGEAAHTLTAAELPTHTHGVAAQTGNGNAAGAAGAVWASSTAAMFAPTPDTAMGAAAVAPAGGGQPHPNLPPYLTLTFAIALAGIFPSRN